MSPFEGREIGVTPDDLLRSGLPLRLKPRVKEWSSIEKDLSEILPKLKEKYETSGFVPADIITYVHNLERELKHYFHSKEQTLINPNHRYSAENIARVKSLMGIAKLFLDGKPDEAIEAFDNWMEDRSMNKEEIKRGKPIPHTGKRRGNYNHNVDNRRPNPTEGKGTLRTLDGKHLRPRPLIGGKDTLKDLYKNLERWTEKPSLSKKYPENFDVKPEDFKLEEQKDYQTDKNYREYIKEKNNNINVEEPHPRSISPRERKELRIEDDADKIVRNFGRDKTLKREKKRKILGILR